MATLIAKGKRLKKYLHWPMVTRVLNLSLTSCLKEIPQMDFSTTQIPQVASGRGLEPILKIPIPYIPKKLSKSETGRSRF